MDEIKLETKATSSDEITNSSEAVENISNALGLLGSIISELVNVDTVKNVVSGALHYFAEKIEKYFDEKTKCYEKWGYFGWSFSPSMYFEIFETNINSQNEAYEMMKHFVKRREINEIVVSLKNAGVDKEEIKEIEQNFSKIYVAVERQYKKNSRKIYCTLSKRIWYCICDVFYCIKKNISYYISVLKNKNRENMQ